MNNNYLLVAAGQATTEQQLQCYACGMPRVHPENDILGSYGVKKYNHSCQCREMLKEWVGEKLRQLALHFYICTGWGWWSGSWVGLT